MRFSIVGCVVGALVALLVYAVGTSLTDHRPWHTIWIVAALAVWLACTFFWRGPEPQ